MEKLQHESHDHLLSIAELEDDGVRCEACRQSISGSCYICDICKYYLHKSCTDLPLETVQHPSHRHPLAFIEELEGDGILCKGCIQSILGPCYGCNICKYFLHKSCTELPTWITHPLDPHYIFELFHSINEGIPCSYCTRVIQGFGYSSLRLVLDIICGHTSLLKLQQQIQHRTHNTSIYISKPIIFSCDACGVEHKGKSYLCTTCGIMVNERCVTSPKILKHDNHKHNLILVDCLPFEDFKFLHKCEICHEALNRECWTYYCKKCRYFVHLKCAKSKTKLPSDSLLQIDEANLVTLPSPDESMNHITLLIKKISEQENYERAVEINHPSHMHPLIFFDDQRKALVLNNARYVEQCNGCVLPISAPFYRCSETKCRFFLHEGCARLPNQLQHPSHVDHTLELDTKLSIRGDSCDICNQDGNIFMYRCNTCKYKIDCKCASLASIIRHEAHEHVLVLQTPASEIYCQQYCSLCANFTRLVFACDSCRFNICLNCVLLRRVMRHRYDEHPFKLTYSPSHLDADEFYCEICEKEIDPNLCFYHCIACDQSTHPKCISTSSWLKFLNWKFGITLKVEIHPHILTLVKQPKRGSSCGKCDNTLAFVVYECEPCNFWLHRHCLKREN